MFEEGNLIFKIEELVNDLNTTIDQYAVMGESLADAQAEYNVLLRQKALVEKDKGVSVTFLDKFLKGDPEVAELRKKRDIAESRYKTLGEKINAIKLAIRILDAQISREWSTRQSGY